MTPVTDPAILKQLNAGLPSDKPQAQIAAEGAAKRSEGVNPDGSIPGMKGNLDRSKAGDNWSTIGTAENGLNLTRVVPGRGLIAKNPAEFLGEQFRRSGDSYGAFETDQAGADFMKGLKPVTDPAILAQLNGESAKPNTAVDVVRSIPGGLVKGVAAIAGLPGDARSAMDAGSRYILEKTGLAKPQQTLSGLITGAPATTPELKSWVPQAPTSGDIEGAISKPFGGFYEPQTQAGKYAETLSSFAPSALSPGSTVRRVARVAIPGAASEAAGQATEGTPLAPYGRTLGALVGGGVTGLGEGLANERAQSARTPSTAQVRAAGGAQYRAIAATPVTITPQMASAIGGEPGRAAIQEAIRGAEANRETALVQELQSLLGPTLPSHVSVDAADKVGQAFRDMGRGAMRGENPNANFARGAFARRADVETTVQQVPGINEGRALWSQARKSEDIDAAIRAAQEAHTTPAGAGDLNQALRREFGKLVRDADFMDGLTHAEQDALRRVANGTFTANLLQRLGKFSPVRNHLTAVAELFGGTTGGLPAEAIGAAVAGEAARQGGRMATVRNARLASELVRSGGTTVRQLGSTTVRGAATALAIGQRPEEAGGYVKLRNLSRSAQAQ